MPMAQKSAELYSFGNSNAHLPAQNCNIGANLPPMTNETGAPPGICVNGIGESRASTQKIESSLLAWRSPSI